MQWFGTYWPSPLTWTEHQVTPPFGVRCWACEEEIGPGDQGVIIPSPFEDPAFEPHSLETQQTVRQRRRVEEATRIVLHRTCLSDRLLRLRLDGAEVPIIDS